MRGEEEMKNQLSVAVAKLQELEVVKNRIVKLRDDGFDRETIILTLEDVLDPELLEQLLDMVFDNNRQRLAKLEMEMIRNKEFEHGKRRRK